MVGIGRCNYLNLERSSCEGLSESEDSESGRDMAEGTRAQYSAFVEGKQGHNLGGQMTCLVWRGTGL